MLRLLAGMVIYWCTKFGCIFAEEIECPEDDRGYDLFYALEKLDTVDKEIPLYA